MNPALLGKGRRLSWYTPGAINLVVEGNSIAAGGYTGQPLVGGLIKYLQTNVYPFNLHTCVNVAIGGQTTQAMIDNQADVNAAFVPGKQNVLVIQEITNQQSQGATPTGESVVALQRTYITQQTATNNWASVIVASAPPVYSGDPFGQPETDTTNARIDAANVVMLRDWPQFAQGCIDWRIAGGPFDSAHFPNYLRATFFSTTPVNGSANNDLFATETTPLNQRIHPLTLALSLMAPTAAQTLLRSRLR